MGTFFSRRSQKRRKDATARRTASRSMRPGPFAHSFEPLESRSMLAWGGLDPTFGDHGIVRDESPADINRTKDSAIASKILSDGKILVLQSTYSGNGEYDVAMSRFLSDGTSDFSFGGFGRIRSDFGKSEVPTDFAIQADNKIIVVGTRSAATFGKIYNTVFLARYNSDGTLDQTFGTQGYVLTTSFDPANLNKATDTGRSLALQQDGKIVVVGKSGSTTLSDFGIARFNADGTIDSTFGNSGYKFIDLGGTTDAASHVEIQSDGKILIGGSAGDSLASQDFALVRLNADSSIDSSFGTQGVVKTDFGTDIGGELRDFSFTPSGKVLAAGRIMDSPNSKNYHFAFVQYNPADGSLDTLFNMGGKKTYAFSGITNHDLTDVVVQSDGTILAYGALGTTSMGFLQFSSRGGAVRSWSWSDAFTLRGVATGRISVQADGRIVSAATTNIADQSPKAHVARFHPNGSIDESFGEGRVSLANMGLITSVQASNFLKQADGKTTSILRSGGYGGNSIYGTGFLVRYNPDGSIDSSFGHNGVSGVPDPPGVGSFEYHDLAFRPDGKIIAVGRVGSSIRSEYIVSLFNANGSIDLNYATYGAAVLRVNGTNSTTAVACAVEFTADGKMVVAGYSGNYIFVKIDSTTTKLFDMGSPTGPFEMVIQPDGKFLFGGNLGNYAAMRLNADLSLDASFDLDGRVGSRIGDDNLAATSLALLPDGRFVVVGSSGTKQIAVARYNSDGSLDGTFNDVGYQILSIPGYSTSYPTQVEVQQNGKIVVAGEAGSPVSDTFALVLKPNGELDTSFNDDGIFVLPSFANGDLGNDLSDEHSTGLAIRADGKILLIGSTAATNLATGYISDFAQSVATSLFMVQFEQDPSFNIPPTVSDIAAQEMSEDGSLAVDFVVNDPEDLANLVVTASSSNTDLVENFEVVIGSDHDRSIVIVPKQNQFGSATITVSVSDGTTTTIETFQLTVQPVNDLPVAENQSINVEADLEYFGTLGGSDIDSPSLQFQIGTEPTKGTVTILNAATGEYVYLASAGSSGIDSFTFRVTDSDGGISNEATISITIIPPLEPLNRAPTAASQTLRTMVGLRHTGKLTGNDADQDPIRFKIVTAPTKGTLRSFNSSTGTFTYIPFDNASGSDSFTFYAYDNKNDVSNTATVSISVAAANQSVKAVLVNETLVITGTTNADNLVISPNGSKYNVTIAGINTLVNGLSTPINFSNVKKIDATLGDGADRFWVKQRITLDLLVVNAGTNDDTIILGADPNVAANNNVQASQYGTGGYLNIFSYNIQTGAGNDKFYERYARLTSNRSLTMEDGNDTFDLYGAFSNGPGNLVINAGDGDDVINLGYGTFGGITTIDAGIGNDLVSAYANRFVGASSFGGSDGDDTLAFDVNRYDVSAGIYGGSNIDFILFSRSVAAGATVTLNGDAQDDELIVGRYITGSADGAFTYENGGSSIYSLVIDAGTGNDRATIAANTIENLFAQFGDGDDDLTLDYNLLANMPSLVGGLGTNKLRNLFSLVVNASDFTLVV